MKPQRLSILYLISSNKVYGAERVVGRLSQGLLQRGHRVLVGVIDSFSRPNEFETYLSNLNVPFAKISSSGPLDWTITDRIRQIILNEDIEIVHSHNYKADFYALFARGKRPWIVTAHCWGSTNLKSAFYDKVDQFIVRFADAVVGVSENLMRDFERIFLPKNKCVYIPNGIGCNALEKDELDDEFIIAFVGRLEREKNVLFVLEAFNRLIETSNFRNKLECWLVGDGSLKPLVEDALDSFVYRDKIKLFGKVPSGRMAELYRDIDCLFLPSFKEGLPMVVLESLCNGLVVVGSDVSLADIGNTDCKRIVDKLDVEDAVRGLEEMAEIYFSNRDRFLQFSSLANRIAGQFSENLMVERYENLYYNVLNSKDVKVTKKHKVLRMEKGE